ncbi:hypothetical protein EDC01DRAFT_636273 [Geopyxis carbonaria]|nr:hypothetical protein EDC01DRAFT_636273 [Geopyxis carbonaria]
MDQHQDDMEGAESSAPSSPPSSPVPCPYESEEPIMLRDDYSASDIVHLQRALNRYHALLLNEWNNATGGSEMPPSNYLQAPDISNWTSVKYFNMARNYEKFCDCRIYLAKGNYWRAWMAEWAFAVRLPPVDVPRDEIRMLHACLVNGETGLPSAF